MRLRSISLKNFKSFADAVEVPFARISYLIGPNGAGKSNVIDALEKIAGIMRGADYKPEQTDYFDNDNSLQMELAVTVDLSSETRLRLFKKLPDTHATASRNPLLRPIFRRMRCSVRFSGSEKAGEKIEATIEGETLRTLAEAYRMGDAPTVEMRDLGAIDTATMSLPEPAINTTGGIPTMSALMGQIDEPLSIETARFFYGLRILGAGRKIDEIVPAREASSISHDGHNLPGEFNSRDRHGQDKFGEYMKRMTQGDPESIEPRIRGTNIVLETKGEGLEHRRPHTDLGSGEEQSLIMGWQLFNAPSSIFIVKEPELHLHAERQKRIHHLIRNSRRGLQFVIETHSPVFLGGGDGERMLLVTKSKGRSEAARIAPENIRLIREELGISHADSLYNANVLLVEGESEFTSFPVFWKTLCLDPSRVSWFSLGGAGNTKQLPLVLGYLKNDDRRVFTILDRHRDTVDHVRGLQERGVLGDNFHILAQSFEDEFSSAQIISAIGKTVAYMGRDPPLTADRLDVERSKSSVSRILKNRCAASDLKFDKIDLARQLSKLPRDEIPDGISNALSAAADLFRKAAAHAGHSGNESGY